MDELVRWLGEQLDADAAIATAARGQGEGRWRHVTDYHTGRVEDERGETVVYDEGAPLPEEAEHIAEHDPARVLREINAKRELLRFAEAIHDHHETFMTGVASRLEGTLRLFALAYKDRAGYRSEWAP